MYIDTHCHLDSEKYDEDRAQVIESLKDAGIDYVINPGCNMESSKKSIRLARDNDIIYAAVGVHPHDANELEEDESRFDELKRLAGEGKVVAIGEIGLDYHYDFSPRKVQKKWFEKQVKLAKELNIPIIVHDREAHQDTFEIIAREAADGNLRGVIHSFSGSLEMANEYIKMGFFIGLGGVVTFKNAKKPKEVAENIDLEYLLVETDGPYLTPEPNRGKRNNPAYVRHTANYIANLRGMSPEKLAEITTENAKRLFGI
ncbi:MAG: TatD family hydrolase [Tissierellales bacterium]|nr:TatD family hydrolase [Tissierellales bacterium]